MALTKNTNIDYRIKEFAEWTYPVASGAIHIYRGAILNIDTSGFTKLGGDVASEKFIGISLKELDQATGGANGDNEILVIPKGSGQVVELPVTTTITRANIGDLVYSDGDDAVDIVAGVTNNVLVGTIVDFIDANTAKVLI